MNNSEPTMTYKNLPDEVVSLKRPVSTFYNNTPVSVDQIPLKDLPAFLMKEFTKAAERDELMQTLAHYVGEAGAAHAFDAALQRKLDAIAGCNQDNTPAIRVGTDPSNDETLKDLKRVLGTMSVRARKEGE